MTTKHTHPVVFGRKVAGCPRCEELKAGAAPVQWHGRTSAADERRHAAEVRAHRCAISNCGPVCTAFQA